MHVCWIPQRVCKLEILAQRINAQMLAPLSGSQLIFVFFLRFHLTCFNMRIWLKDS